MLGFQIEISKSFNKDLKCHWHKPKIMQIVQDAIEKLKEGRRLPYEHVLKGDWKGHRECHLPCGLLLIWTVSGSLVKLKRLGTHHQIFGL